MCKELINMINSNSISVDRFFTMDPFSYANDKQYGKITTSINFFGDLFVTTNKTYERLALMAKLSEDDSLSAIVVTGYSGSGKTCFLKFCEAIIQNKEVLMDYNSSQKEIEELYSFVDISDKTNGDVPSLFDENLKEKATSETKLIQDEFNGSLGKIRTILCDRYFNSSKDEIRKDIANYLNKCLKGKTVYLDFDKDKQEYKLPLKLKLIRQIETHLNNNDSNIKKAFDFYEFNRKEFREAFEGCSSYWFDKSVKVIFDNRNKNFELYKEKFNSTLNNLEIDQLLGIEVLLRMSENLSDDPKNIYYFVDNIDMISGSNNNVLIESIGKFWDFIKEMQSFFHTIRQESDKFSQNKIWIDTYEKFKYVFSMRETTAMHICDHLRSRISSYAKHMDISTDIDKSFIFKKRYDILKKYIDEKRISNNSFIEISQCIESIIEDKFFKWNFFELFNNDYRKAMECLCAIGSRKSSSIYSSLPLIKSDNSYIKFGGRGVIIKTICDYFKKWNYFSNLGIPMLKESSKRKPYNVTLIRIILTVLDNLQKESDIPEGSFFFIKRENCISLRRLYESVQMFCEEDTFLTCIKKMFSGRNWSYWNHLITFDNMIEYSEKDLKDSLDDENSSDIYVRCTKAGERYLNTLCVHYEFFSCRFAVNRSNGLFSQSYNKNKGKYNFEKQIEEVKNHVKDCCNELHEVNKMLMDDLGYDKMEDILESQYVKYAQFHEERIIHNHITYLDAYRLYLLSNPLKDDVIGVNKCLIGHIKDYLDFLKNNNEFYSQNSESLYKELSTCIKEIEKKEYNDTEIKISRTYYQENFSHV